MSGLPLGVDTPRKSGKAILERNLISQHQKLKEPYAYKLVIREGAKKSYFDAADVMMHICRGFCSVADGSYVYHLKFVFNMAAEIFDKYYMRELTKEQTISLALEQGRHLYWNNYGMTRPGEGRDERGVALSMVFP